MRPIIIALGLALGATADGCVPITVNEASAERNNLRVLTWPELDGANATTALDAVRKLRGYWLTSHRTEGRTGPSVYVDGVWRGGIDYLESLPLDVVGSIKYLSPNDATTRWGTNNSAGAIEVILATGRTRTLWQ